LRRNDSAPALRQHIGRASTGKIGYHERSDLPFTPSAGELVLFVHADERLAAAIARLSGPERRAVELRYRENRLLTEIAAELDRPPVEVARLLLRALRQMREALEDS
jgi:RNA polymerase sigma factor (sigma-70 family)